jgi:hypothetical protein
MKEYTVLVGDVIKSGTIEDRNHYWKKLSQVVKKINHEYREVFFAPCTILKGDEISAVMKEKVRCYHIIRDIQESFFPYEIRLVCVHDYLDLAINTKDASIMDGPAFWKANKYLEGIKKENKYIHFDLKDPRIDSLITTVANLVASRKYEWTETEKKIIETYEIYNKQIQVAKKHQIRQQSVSNALIRAHLKEIRASEEIINYSLNSFYGDGNAD